jgi:hypothetical protein
MLRTMLAALVLSPLCCGQSLSGFRWIVEIDGSGSGQLAGLGTDAQGNFYLAGTTRSPQFQVKSAVPDHLAGDSDIFVTKLDPSGNIVYSTYFGGTGAELATAMTVDAQGNVYVIGHTASADFPITPGAYSPSVPSPSIAGSSLTFLFKLRPDGATGYATYFSNFLTAPNAIAVDSAGSVYITGLSYGGLVTTPGAYRTSCTYVPPAGIFSFVSINGAFLTRFDPGGSRLEFSTYLGVPLVASAIALAPDGSAYVAGAPTRTASPDVLHLDANGTSVIASAATGLSGQGMVLAADGSLYLIDPAGMGAGLFTTTPGAFQPSSDLAPGANSPQTGIVRMDAQLSGVLASTCFGGVFGNGAKTIAVDARGDVYFGGYTSPRSLPMRTPFQQGFGQSITGYVAELSPDLSALLFSSQFGDNEAFGVNGLAIGANNITLSGNTGLPSQNVWVNSLVITGAPRLRIDAIQNQATGFTDPLSEGETIVIQGAGFDSSAQVLIGGVAVTPISIASTNIVAVVPAGLFGRCGAGPGNIRRQSVQYRAGRTRLSVITRMEPPGCARCPNQIAPRT